MMCTERKRDGVNRIDNPLVMPCTNGASNGVQTCDKYQWLKNDCNSAARPQSPPHLTRRRWTACQTRMRTQTTLRDSPRRNSPRSVPSPDNLILHIWSSTICQRVIWQGKNSLRTISL